MFHTPRLGRVVKQIDPCSVLWLALGIVAMLLHVAPLAFLCGFGCGVRFMGLGAMEEAHHKASPLDTD